MSRATLEDVAREAGVSIATVDRVVNGRAGVHARTIERVRQAIDRLSFLPDRHASRLARSRVHNFYILLPSGHNDFMKNLEAEFLGARQRLSLERVNLEIRHVDVFDGPVLARALEQLPEPVDGVALVGLDHPEVVEAVNNLAARGVIVLTLVSDLPSSRRTHFVGIDNFAAGRTAASLTGRFTAGKTGKVGLIAGSLALRDHIERQNGFEQVLTREYPGLEILPLREARDENERVRQAAAGMLEEYPDLVAIYSAGGGQAGVIAAIHESGRHDIVFICHELTALSRRHLVQGTIDAVIGQDCGHMARSTARIMLALKEKDSILAAQERIRIDIFLRDNVP